MHDPERLVLDVLRDSLDAGPHARAANYVEAIGMNEAGVRLRNAVTGEEFRFKVNVVVNTSGPWTDLTNQALGEPAPSWAARRGRTSCSTTRRSSR